jgi:Flp pilus assembly protein TadG
MGIVEFGLLFYNQQVLTNSSREGARAGIALTGRVLEEKTINNAGEFETEVAGVVERYCQDHLITFSTGLVPTTAVASPSAYPYEHPNELSVTVTYTYTFLVPDLLDLNTSMQLSASTVMNMERELE